MDPAQNEAKQEDSDSASQRPATDPSSGHSSSFYEGDTLPAEAAPGVPTPLPGRAIPPRIGPYLVEGELGSGGMGTVYRARKPGEQAVAVKLIRSGLHQPGSLRARFEREARTLARLEHAGIVPVLDVGTHEGRPYLVMPLIEGRSLRVALREDGPRPPREAAQLLRKLVAALEHAHDLGVIHRDIKPDNILLQRADAQPLLLDFGLAKDATDTTLTRSGAVLGTPSYMAPEQVRGDSHGVDERTDVYSLGVVLYELLTGARPFQGSSRNEVYERILAGSFPEPRALNPEIDANLAAICRRAMAAEPADRYVDMRALRADLDHYLMGGAVAVRQAWSPRRWSRSRRLMLGLLLLASVLVLLLTWRESRLRALQTQAARLDSGWAALSAGRQDAAAATLLLLRELGHRPAQEALAGQLELERAWRALQRQDSVAVRSQAARLQGAHPAKEVLTAWLEAQQRGVDRALLQAASEQAESLLVVLPAQLEQAAEWHWSARNTTDKERAEIWRQAQQEAWAPAVEAALGASERLRLLAALEPDKSPRRGRADSLALGLDHLLWLHANRLDLPEQHAWRRRLEARTPHGWQAPGWGRAAVRIEADPGVESYLFRYRFMAGIGPVAFPCDADGQWIYAPESTLHVPKVAPERLRQQQRQRIEAAEQAVARQELEDAREILRRTCENARGYDDPFSQTTLHRALLRLLELEECPSREVPEFQSYWGIVVTVTRDEPGSREPLGILTRIDGEPFLGGAEAINATPLLEGQLLGVRLWNGGVADVPIGAGINLSEQYAPGYQERRSPFLDPSLLPECRVLAPDLSLVPGYYLLLTTLAGFDHQSISFIATAEDTLRLRLLETQFTALPRGFTWIPPTRRLPTDVVPETAVPAIWPAASPTQPGFAIARSPLDSHQYRDFLAFSGLEDDSLKVYGCNHDGEEHYPISAEHESWFRVCFIGEKAVRSYCAWLDQRFVGFHFRQATADEVRLAIYGPAGCRNALHKTPFGLDLHPGTTKLAGIDHGGYLERNELSLGYVWLVAEPRE